MTYKNGEKAKAGDVIHWKCWDHDDNTLWGFTGIYHSESKIVYLGGGNDFGMAIGKIQTSSEIQWEAENNDFHNQGIEKIGYASDISSLIRGYVDNDC